MTGTDQADTRGAKPLSASIHGVRPGSPGAVERRPHGRRETLRVAVHPGDVAKPHIRASIGRTPSAPAAGRTPGRHARLPAA